MRKLMLNEGINLYVFEVFIFNYILKLLIYILLWLKIESFIKW